MIKRKKTKIIQTLLTSNRKNRRNRGKFYIHLHDCSHSWIGQVTSIEIDDIQLVLCSQSSTLSGVMQSCKYFRPSVFTLTLGVGGFMLLNL